MHHLQFDSRPYHMIPLVKWPDSISIWFQPIGKEDTSDRSSSGKAWNFELCSPSRTICAVILWISALILKVTFGEDVTNCTGFAHPFGEDARSIVNGAWDDYIALQRKAAGLKEDLSIFSASCSTWTTRGYLMYIQVVTICFHSTQKHSKVRARWIFAIALFASLW